MYHLYHYLFTLLFYSAPFHHVEPSQSTSTSHLTCYWVSPPTESRPLELGRPMAMQYNVVYDATVKDDVVPKLVRQTLLVL
jgi:hypothetical protein